MKVEKSQCEKILIHGLEHMDPITVYIEDLGPGRGQITIKCWNESWTTGWGSMGDHKIADFFCSCDHHYIAKNLSQVPSSIPDYAIFKSAIKKKIGHDIVQDPSFKESAIDLLGWVNSMDADGESWGGDEVYSKLCEIFGSSDWMFDIPQKTNPKYKYLCRIIDTVQEALRN